MNASMEKWWHIFSQIQNTNWRHLKFFIKTHNTLYLFLNYSVLFLSSKCETDDAPCQVNGCRKLGTQVKTSEGVLQTTHNCVSTVISLMSTNNHKTACVKKKKTTITASVHPSSSPPMHPTKNAFAYCIHNTHTRSSVFFTSTKQCLSWLMYNHVEPYRDLTDVNTKKTAQIIWYSHGARNIHFLFFISELFSFLPNLIKTKALVTPKKK